jgi:hypothetical protein
MYMYVVEILLIANFVSDEMLYTIDVDDVRK